MKFVYVYLSYISINFGILSAAEVFDLSLEGGIVFNVQDQKSNENIDRAFVEFYRVVLEKRVVLSDTEQRLFSSLKMGKNVNESKVPFSSIACKFLFKEKENEMIVTVFDSGLIFFHKADNFADGLYNTTNFDNGKNEGSVIDRAIATELRTVYSRLLKHNPDSVKKMRK